MTKEEILCRPVFIRKPHPTVLVLLWEVAGDADDLVDQ
jgi:hypothetical protein